MNMLNNASDYLSGNVNKDKANKLAAESADVTIEDNWKGDIKARAFERLENPVSINTNDITGIEDGAFKDCIRLETLIMPNIERVGENVFEGCFKLHKVDVKDENMAGVVIEKIKACNLKQRIDIYIAGEFKISIKNNCEYLFNDKVLELIEGDELSVPHYPFTGMVKNIISAGALKDMGNINHLHTDNVTGVEDKAFENCSELTTISLPSMTSIGNEVFKGCTKLRKVQVSDDMVSKTKEVLKGSGLQQQIEIYANDAIEDHLHNNLSNYIIKSNGSWARCSSIAIPEYYIKIDDNAFNGLSMTNINTNEVATIGNNVLRSCDNLEEVHLPNVSKIGFGFCSNCPNLKKITVKDGPMANVIKDTFSGYGVRTVDLNIYIDGNDEPFAIIRKREVN